MSELTPEYHTAPALPIGPALAMLEALRVIAAKLPEDEAAAIQKVCNNLGFLAGPLDYVVHRIIEDSCKQPPHLAHRRCARSPT